MRALNNSVTRILTVLALLCFSATVNVVAAQERERHMISARAGGVNNVVGSVTWLRQGETEWQALTTERNLRTGDRVRTGIGARVEILLNPGSYLRLNENSEVELSDASLEHLRLRLLAGSAIIEAANAPGDNEALLEIATPHTTVAIIRNGLYRINILAAANASEVLVHNGRALVGAGIPVRVDSSRRVLVSAAQMGELQVVRFDRNDRDSFDEWSRERGRTLLALNRRLTQRSVSAVLATFDNFDAYYGRSSGLWYFDPSLRCYTYLPWGRGASSPYGSFGNTLWYWGYSLSSVCRCNPRTLPVQSYQPVAGGGSAITPPVTPNPGNPSPGEGRPPRRRLRDGDGDRDRPLPVDGRWRRERPADGGERSERRERWQRSENADRNERRERWQRSENGERRERGERGSSNPRSGGGDNSSQSESASPRAESAPQRSEPAPSAPAYSPPPQSYSPPPEPPATRDISPPVQQSNPRVEGNATP